MFTPRRQPPVDEFRIPHDSPASQYATVHRDGRPDRNGKPTIVSRAALLLLSIASASAIAQAPINDGIANATEAYLGFNDFVDTTAATTDADDAELNENCGFLATDASVWYSYTATSDHNVIVDVSRSDYSASVLIGAGDPGDLVLATCGWDRVAFHAVAGETYYVLAFDNQFDGVGNGGALDISFFEALTPVLEDFTVNRYGAFDPGTGVATVSGSYTCANGDFFEVAMNGTQAVGRFVISGYGYFLEYDTCDRQPHPWVAEMTSYNGKFGGGKTITMSYTYTCGYLECSYGYGEHKVQLRGGSKR